MSEKLGKVLKIGRDAQRPRIRHLKPLGVLVDHDHEPYPLIVLSPAESAETAEDGGCVETGGV